MKKTLDEFYVPYIKPLKMYVSSHIELAWRDPRLLRMMSNENPLPPSKKVIDTIRKYSRLSNRYPDQGLILRRKIAKINGLEGPQNVVLGNGSSEIFDLIFRVFILPGQRVIQHTPCFGIYKLRTEILGGKIISVPMTHKDNLLHFDARAILKAVDNKTKIIVIANPNNPTGNFMRDEDFIRIARSGVPFVIDEAYIEYNSMNLSKVSLINKYKNVIITRTFSKAYGLAGLRIGYLLADETVAGHIASTLLPWNVGTISMWTALSALEDKKDLRKRVDFNNSQRSYIKDSLKNIPGLVIFPSAANFILFDAAPAGKKGDEIIEFAQKNQIIIRGTSTMYDSNGWFRVTIGTEKENRRFVNVIKKFFAG